MSILHMSLSLPPPHPHTLSSSRVLSSPNTISLTSKLSHLSLTTPKTTRIYMGGGPRTYPGGVSKWQWKRMQANKSKQLLKARLTRERQIYEMRKRAELRAAVSELEKPWEVVGRVPTLFSVGADEQLKVLADRFQKPGGFDMWSEKDGPQLFDKIDGLPTARFFPKGVVHSVKPYGKIAHEMGQINSELLNSESEMEMGMRRNGYKSSRRLRGGESSSEGDTEVNSTMERNGKHSNGKFWKKRNRRRSGVDQLDVLNELNSGKVDFLKEKREDAPITKSGDSRFRGGRVLRKSKETNSGVYDMRRQQDGSYGFQAEN